MKASPENPDIKWYLGISKERGVTPRCPFATVERCPRYYQSLSLLGEAGGTKILPEEEARLKELWKNSEFLPRTGEQAPAVIGTGEKWVSLSEWCPEVVYDGFGFFVKSLGDYYDSMDREIAYQRLQSEGVHESHWQWRWEWMKPMHFTECTLYSTLSHNAPKLVEAQENKEPILTIKPGFWGMSVNLNEAWRRLSQWALGRKR